MERTWRVSAPAGWLLHWHGLRRGVMPMPPAIAHAGRRPAPTTRRCREEGHVGASVLIHASLLLTCLHCGCRRGPFGSADRASDSLHLGPEAASLLANEPATGMAMSLMPPKAADADAGPGARGLHRAGRRHHAAREVGLLREANSTPRLNVTNSSLASQSNPQLHTISKPWTSGPKLCTRNPRPGAGSGNGRQPCIRG